MADKIEIKKHLEDKEEISKLLAEKDDKISNFEQTVEEWDERLKKIKKDNVDELVKKDRDNVGELAKKEETIKKLQKKFDRLEEIIVELNTQLLKKDLSQDESDDIIMKINDNTKKILNMEAEKLDLIETISKLQDEKKVMGSELKRNENNMKQMIEHNLEFVEKNERSEKIIKEREEEIHQYREEIKKLRVKLGHTIGSLEHIKVINEQIEEKVEQMNRANDEIYLQKEEDGRRYRERVRELEIESTDLKEQKTVVENNNKIALKKIKILEREEKLRTDNLSSEERTIILGENEQEKVKIAELEQTTEEAQSRMSLKFRVKEIFKKYGLTVIGVLTAVSTVIGVIVSNLSSGLSNMAKKLGAGLKKLGAKLANILPGMVGAIASFIFRTAGEVIGFLAKNAWLLIVAVVVFFVEEFKKKKQ